MSIIDYRESVIIHGYEFKKVILCTPGDCFKAGTVIPAGSTFLNKNISKETVINIQISEKLENNLLQKIGSNQHVDVYLDPSTDVCYSKRRPIMKDPWGPTTDYHFVEEGKTFYVDCILSRYEKMSHEY